MTECPDCKRPPDAVNHVPGHLFGGGFGLGWFPCPTCHGTARIPSVLEVSLATVSELCSHVENARLSLIRLGPGITTDENVVSMGQQLDAVLETARKLHVALGQAIDLGRPPENLDEALARAAAKQ